MNVATSDLTRLRWIIPAESENVDPGRFLRDRITPAVRELASLDEPDLTYYAGRQWSGETSEAWLTVMVPTGRVDAVCETVAFALPETPTDRSDEDVILQPDCARYRTALRRVTDVALDLLDTGTSLPIHENACSKFPLSCREILAPLLEENSGEYRAICARGAEDEFWEDFFRPAPAMELSRPGHWLWNIAG